MIKHTQIIRRLLPTNCLSVFDHFVGLSLKVLKPRAVYEKMNRNDANIYALSILDRYEYRRDDLDDLCLAGFASSYISKKAVDEQLNLKN